MASGRVHYLDGLRGVAAFGVICFHFRTFFADSLWVPLSGAPPWTFLAPVAALVNGSFAVAIFFVLSGYVIASSADHKSEFLPLRIVKRYLRLALPISASVAFGWVLYALFGFRGEPQVPPGLGETIRLALFDPFVYGACKLNLALWTMKPELIGSVTIYAIYALVPARLRTTALILLALAGLATAWAWYLAFATGALFYTLGVNRLRLPGWSGPLLLLAGLTLGGMGLSEATASPTAILAALLRAAHLPDGEARFLVHALAAGLLVAGLMQTARARDLLSGPIPQWLSRTSFGLYIIHGPILDFFLRWLAKQVQPAHWDMVWLFALFAGLSLTGGWVMTIAADEPTLKLLKRIKPPRAWKRTDARSTA